MKTLSTFLLIVFTLESCKHSFIQEETPEALVSNCNTSDLTYYSEVQTIVGLNCAIESSCHSGNNSWGNFSTYEGIVEKIESDDFLSRLESGTMPPDYTDGPYPLDSCDRVKLITWVNQGYPLE